MKSLEIINRYIKSIKKLLRNLKDTQEGTLEDFDKFCKELEGVFEKYKAKSGDKLRKITIISAPGEKE